MNTYTKFCFHKRTLVLALSITALSAANVIAQSSKSDVDLSTAVTTNAAVLGSNASQRQEIGNASGGTS